MWPEFTNENAQLLLGIFCCHRFLEDYIRLNAYVKGHQPGTT